jgi:alkylation response protein AidB-like acyl-CoA dehydrogenase
MNAAIDATADETLAMLRDGIERYTNEHYSFEQRWSALRSSRGYNEKTWLDYAEMGWLALRLPEDAGGLCADASTTAPLMEAVGARLLMEPLLMSTILCTGLICKRGSDTQREQMFPLLAAGSLKLALAHQESLNASAASESLDAIACEYRDGVLNGSKQAVLHGDCADRLIVSARDREGRLRLCLVDAGAAGVNRRSFRLLDGRGAANLIFQEARAELLAAPGPAEADALALADASDEAAVALCSEALGAISTLNTTTSQYLKIRKQFGKIIGANQALQHRMVEMYMLQQEVRALSLAAQQALDRREPERGRIISGARAFTCGAARRVAAEAVQMHGGIGITDELDVSHYYRRLMVIGTLFGNRECHLDRFAAACSRGGV